ncbi:MAG: hypothetical protein GX874_11650 [Smithella sp.]|nr:hypothetical protein [Smithella sp.]
MTPRINFSHHYRKMIPAVGWESSKLLDVLPVCLEDLSPEFLRYDTSYLDGGEEKQYQLPKSGNYMILLLQANSGAGPIWTTIRSQWSKNGGLSTRHANKLEYYKSHIGEVFECRITE